MNVRIGTLAIVVALTVIDARADVPLALESLAHSSKAQSSLTVSRPMYSTRSLSSSYFMRVPLRPRIRTSLAGDDISQIWREPRDGGLHGTGLVNSALVIQGLPGTGTLPR